MSNEDRIKAEIQQNKALVDEINAKMDVLFEKLKDKDLSEEDRSALKEQLNILEYELIDISADIAMLQEMLDKEVYQEDDNEEKYDPLEEVFTGGDY